MKKRIIVMVLALLCTFETFSREYELEDIMLTYMAFIDHSNLLKYFGLLFMNPNQNSRIHYGKYTIDSHGNKLLEVPKYESDMYELDDTVYYKNNRICGVRCGHNHWYYKIEDNILTVKENDFGEEAYEMNYKSENQLQCYGMTITKNGNEFTVESYEPYKFIFNEDTIEVIQLSKDGDELHKYIYDSHGILLKDIEYYKNKIRAISSYNGVNGYIQEEVNDGDTIHYTNDDFFRRIDKDGYLVYQNSDYSEFSSRFDEFVILPCDDEDNILATVDEIAVPYPEREDENAEISSVSIPNQNEKQSDKEPQKNQKLLYQIGLVIGLAVMAVSTAIVIILKRRKNFEKR